METLSVSGPEPAGSGLGNAMRGGPDLPLSAWWMWVAVFAGDWYGPVTPLRVMCYPFVSCGVVMRKSCVITYPADQVQIGLNAIVVITNGAWLARGGGVVGVNNLVGSGNDLVGGREAEGEVLHVLAGARLGLHGRARLATLGSGKHSREDGQSRESNGELHVGRWRCLVLRDESVANVSTFESVQVYRVRLI